MRGQASPEIMMVARVFVGFYALLGVVAVFTTVRLLLRPAEASPQTLAACQRMLPWVRRLAIGATLFVIYGIWSRQYYLLFASAFFYALVLPIALTYWRTKKAIEAQSADPNP